MSNPTLPGANLATVHEYGSEAEWLDGRSQGIGASDVATVLGMNQWKSAYTLYYEKRGELAPQESTIPMRLGHYLEPFIDRLYQEETGRRTVDLGDFTVLHHPEYPWLRCTPDRVVLEIAPQRVVELKSIGEHAAKALGEGGDLTHQVQVQIQMACLGMEQGDIAALAGNRSFRVIPVERNDRFLAVAIAKCQEFWDRVLAGDPPPVDGSESTCQTLKALHPDDNGDSVPLPPEAVEASERLERIREQIRPLEKEKLQLENLLRAAIGDATYGTGPGVRWSLKTTEREPRWVGGSKYRTLRRKEVQ